MEQITFKGGYGEHGRSCFVVNYSKEASYMIDCGIMDTDLFPYPIISRKELKKVKYLFLTHCHKDHAGAFEYFVENGFEGHLITSRMTLELADIQYEKILLLDTESMPGHFATDELDVVYGRSGHCPGSLWFHIMNNRKSFFFSGDYQAESLLYQCDVVSHRSADVAIIDCAHNQTNQTAKELRKNLVDSVQKMLESGHRVIFPVPKYGRGIELLYLLVSCLPDARINVDAKFAYCARKLIKEQIWYQSTLLDSASKVINNILKHPVDLKKNVVADYNIMLIADTHLAEKCNIDFVSNAISKDAEIVITGRRKKGSYSDGLCEKNMAHRYLYPHHQSNGDLNKMIADNNFSIVFPFHNPEKKVIIA
ncbi:MAG: MBL fold metallo-hydrolase [Lachnospiraceae bacterium]